MKQMNFPKSELDSLRDRLQSGLPIYTTRISGEVGKYKQSDLVKTNITPGILLIKEITVLENLESHPFLAELEDSQKNEILSYSPPYELIKLEAGEKNRG